MHQERALDTDFDGGYVLVIGSAGIDVKGRPVGELCAGVPGTGIIRNSLGGVARNIADNLTRLEVATVLMTAVGDDAPGDRVIQSSAARGINCGYTRRVPGARTGISVALLHENGDPYLAMSDYAIAAAIDSDYLQQHEVLFSQATMVAIDATLSEEALETLFEIAAQYQLRVCADPTSPRHASKLRPYLSQLYLLTPNMSETSALCDVPVITQAEDRHDASGTVRELVRLGAEIAVVTMGKEGLAYADNSGVGFIRATEVEVVDTSGAGDAFSAAVIFGLLNDVTVDEAMRLGATAAALTLTTPETVFPALSQERLYDALVV